MSINENRRNKRLKKRKKEEIAKIQNNRDPRKTNQRPTQRFIPPIKENEDGPTEGKDWEVEESWTQLENGEI